MNEFNWQPPTGDCSLIIYPIVYALITRVVDPKPWRLQMSVVTNGLPREIRVWNNYETLEDAKLAAEEIIIRAKLEGKI